MARVSNGEYVINADATARYRPLIEAINDNRIPAFADGGYVGGMAPLAMGPESSAAVTANTVTVNNIAPNITVNVEGSASSGDSDVDEKQAQRIAKAVDGQVRATVVDELRRQMRSGAMMHRV